MKDRYETLAWLGVPYAKPPVGALRWKPPLEPEPWPGIRYATEFSAVPVQSLHFLDHHLGSEDCLYLNIWRPDSPETGLPVHVWIHGGDNLVGSSDMNPDYHGHALAAKAKAIVVSINYRLGIFGWFRHPALADGDPRADSGNFGLLDMIAALRWVRDNIGSFGGDPERVTIAGESSGALNVLALLIAPEARGLFCAAAAQSPFLPDFSLEDAAAYADAVALDYLRRSGRAAAGGQDGGIGVSADSGELAGLLRAADPFDLLPTALKDRVDILSFPYLFPDGHVLPAEGFDALAAPEKRARATLIVGNTKEEAKVFQWLAGMRPGDAFYESLAALTSARWRFEYTEKIADAVSAGGMDKVFVYRFDWGAAGPEGEGVLSPRAEKALGASHGIDMSFFMQTPTVYGNIFPFLIFTRRNAEGREDLKRIMRSYLDKVLRTGNPNGDDSASPGEGLPLWEPWDSLDPAPSFMVFDADRETARLTLGRGRIDYEGLKHSLLTAQPRLAELEAYPIKDY